MYKVGPIKKKRKKKWSVSLHSFYIFEKQVHLIYSEHLNLGNQYIFLVELTHVEIK